MSRSIGLAPGGGGAVVHIETMAAKDEQVQRTTYNAGGDLESAVAARKLELLADHLSQVNGQLSTEDRRLIINRYIALFDPMNDALKANLIAGLAVLCIEAGDVEFGRPLLSRARAVILALPEGEMKDFSLLTLTAILANQNQTDEALSILPALRPASRPTALEQMVRFLHHGGAFWSPQTGYVGGPLAQPPIVPNPDAARPALPRILAAARTLDAGERRTRLLDAIARVQAAGGDFAGALETVELLPDPANSDELDVLKPMTLALIGSLQTAAGDQAGADASFARSRDSTKSLPDHLGKPAAWTVLAEHLEKSGRSDLARAVLAEAISASAAVAEPRRSRLLCLLVQTQAKVDGVAEAVKTADSIRDEPGLEKLFAYVSLVRAAKEQGDLELSRDLARRTLPLTADRPDERAQQTKWISLVNTDPLRELDHEIPAVLARVHRTAARSELDESAGVDAPKPKSPLKGMVQSATHPDKPHLAAYRDKGFDAALEQTEAVETLNGRLQAIQELAQFIASR